MRRRCGAGHRDAPVGTSPGNSGTREAIIEAARQRFSEVGFDKASVRSIAAKAGVGSALVHHYFGTKQDLFVAAVAIPIDPTPVLRRIAETPLDRLGEGLIRNIVGAWDSRPASVWSRRSAASSAAATPP